MTGRRCVGDAPYAGSLDGVVCYPASTRDDATIPVTSGPTWQVALITEQIDDLTILDSVDFTSAEPDPQLAVESLTIGGPATITITEGASIVAQ